MRGRTLRLGSMGEEGKKKRTQGGENAGEEECGRDTVLVGLFPLVLARDLLVESLPSFLKDGLVGGGVRVLVHLEPDGETMGSCDVV